MSDFTLSKQALVRLLERASPDPCEPYGCDPWEPPPEGPHEPPMPLPELARMGAVDVLDRWNWVRLNPQPLPPKTRWRAALVARISVARALSLHESAQALADDGGERAFRMIQRNVSTLVDDWCGTRPPRPFPWPWGPILRSTEKLEPTDLLVAGAQFHKAAQELVGNPLQEVFNDAAGRLFETGLARLEAETQGEGESAP
jgi:hypothetical protein